LISLSVFVISSDREAVVLPGGAAAEFTVLYEIFERATLSRVVAKYLDAAFESTGERNLR
jgi:hypothetical protein